MVEKYDVNILKRKSCKQKRQRERKRERYRARQEIWIKCGGKRQPNACLWTYENLLMLQVELLSKYCRHVTLLCATVRVCIMTQRQKEIYDWIIQEPGDAHLFKQQNGKRKKREMYQLQEKHSTLEWASPKTDRHILPYLFLEFLGHTCILSAHILLVMLVSQHLSHSKDFSKTLCSNLFLIEFIIFLCSSCKHNHL